MPLRIKPIVEGQGEVQAIRPLLERIWYELLEVSNDSIEVLTPFRQPRGKLLKEAELKKAVNAVKIKLDSGAPPESINLVLILIDSEGDCPRDLAPRLLNWAKQSRSDADIACVLPHPMYETWFAAAAESLRGVRGLPADLETLTDVEAQQIGKKWLRDRLPGKYSEPIDQPAFTAQMNLADCRQNSPSFDKLCRELEKRRPSSSSGKEGEDSGTSA